MESALVSSPEVAEAAVVGRPDEITGTAIVAFVSPKGTTNPDSALVDRLKQHVSKAVCNACHKEIDPLGLGLENFAQFGDWRTQYPDKAPVVSSGVMPNGKAFQSPREMKTLLLESHALTAGTTWHTAGMLWRLRPSYVDIELHTQIQRDWLGHSWRVRPFLRILNALDRRDALFYSYQPWRSDDVTPLAVRPVLPVFGVSIAY